MLGPRFFLDLPARNFQDLHILLLTSTTVARNLCSNLQTCSLIGVFFLSVPTCQANKSLVILFLVVLTTNKSIHFQISTQRSAVARFTSKKDNFKKYWDYYHLNQNVILKNSFKKGENTFSCSVYLLLIVAFQNF